MALQIKNISRGRFAINLVNAWNRPELEKAGIGFAEHDERYDYGREWISVVKPLTAGERVSFTGRHFNIDDYELLPHDQYRARPTIYLGGESEPARALAADHADVWFINGQPLDDVNQLIADHPDLAMVRHCGSDCPHSSLHARPTKRPTERTGVFLFDRFDSTVASSDFSSACMLSVRLLPSRAGPAQVRARMRPPRFRAKNFPTCTRSPTARGSADASQCAMGDVAFSSAN
jgi:alkanesulfonate monooxygenase SsuD/methylene tetrahydromethanopterin reductase-like flavin-dependent oxidoreductase (luciferase family)